MGVKGVTIVTDYRQIMKLLLKEQSYRQIAAVLGCAPRTISKAALRI